VIPASLQVHAGCVPQLLTVATTGSHKAAVEATGALAMITSTVSGKAAFCQDADTAALFKLLSGSDSMLLQRNVLNIVSNAAENPHMRQKLRVRNRDSPHFPVAHMGCSVHLTQSFCSGCWGHEAFVQQAGKCIRYCEQSCKGGNAAMCVHASA
jgi:hypothetical protein